MCVEDIQNNSICVQLAPHWINNVYINLQKRGELSPHLVKAFRSHHPRSTALMDKVLGQHSSLYPGIWEIMMCADIYCSFIIWPEHCRRRARDASTATLPQVFLNQVIVCTKNEISEINLMIDKMLMWKHFLWSFHHPLLNGFNELKQLPTFLICQFFVFGKQTNHYIVSKISIIELSVSLIFK